MKIKARTTPLPVKVKVVHDRYKNLEKQDECSTDVQLFILNEQVIKINLSLSSTDQKILITMPSPCPPFSDLSDSLEAV